MGTGNQSRLCLSQNGELSPKIYLAGEVWPPATQQWERGTGRGALLGGDMAQRSVVSRKHGAIILVFEE